MREDPERVEMKSNLNLNSRSYPLLALFALSLLVSIMAETGAGNGSGEAEVHIVYTEKPEGEEPEAYHVRTLASVLGSEEAAKEAIIYSYKTAASGFSAKLTPEQVSQISKEPGVLQVVKSRTYQLHSEPANLHAGPARLH